MYKIFLLLIILFVLFAASSLGQKRNKINVIPKNTKLVTSDIDNFWKAYDLAQKENVFEKKVAIYQRDYLDKGSDGLKAMVSLRIKSASRLATTIERHPKYYKSIRKPSLKTKRMKKWIIKSLIKLKKIYPDAVFPNVYFVIGVLNSSGTTSRNGLLIGTEMYCLTPKTPRDELGSWLKAVLSPIDYLPHIVAHELIHYQQRIRSRTLLERSINEGGADFIGELISGKHINHSQHTYGNKNEGKLWAEFKEIMDNKDFSNWLYNGNKSKNRPADLGYYMGYKICEAYYRNAKNKKQAVKDILLIRDTKKFLAKSGYGDKFGEPVE